MKFRIRSKVAAALVVPLLALVVGSGLLATQSRAAADEVDAEIELALVALGPGSLTSALQDERNFLALDLIGLGDVDAVGVSSFEEATSATDAAADRLRSRVTGLDDVVREAFAPALDSLSGLEEARDRYQASTGTRDFGNIQTADAVFESYQTIIGRFFAATATVAADIDHASLRNGVELFDALNRRGEALSVAIRHLAMDMLSGAPSPEASVAIATAVAEVRVMQQRIDELSVGAYRDVATQTGARDAVDAALATVEGYLAGGDVDLAELLDIQGLGDDTFGDAVTGVLLGEAGDVRAEARERMRVFVVAAAAVISLAILVTYFATTSITRPLRALRREADELARTRLPSAVRSILDTPPGEDVAVPELAAIDVRSRDEVGDVVAALDEVQSATLTLAADQAVLRRNFADSFVNLGRRNQLLLDRQLDFITQLEQNETDPEQLEALFRLDHLATRMRRNAESLLVLAGAESPRQWSAPVAMADVVRAGLGEVEDYQRVNIRHLDDAHVLGRSVAGLAHVLAELAENAIAFSPPGEPVEVKGRWSGNGDYVIAIADNGIGMTAEELERANRRLSGRESYTVAPSRYLGHFVAGNLARQLGVTVGLQDDPAGGLVATVTLPPSVLHTAPVDQPELEREVGPEPQSEPEPVLGSTSGTESEWEPPWDWEPELEPEPHAEVETDPESESEQEPEPEPEPELERILYGRLYGGVTPTEELPVDPVDPFEHAPTTADAGAAADGALPRRVPGAQRPDASLLVRRPVSTEPPAARSAGTLDEPATNGSVGAFGFLQAFQSRDSESPEEDR